jgi:uncharacterized NAD-dependent epimerase/dehydratase family protein|tara:strand:- start:121047 stop:122066 length:1020 start_codon:yes stop_codon:yes gene_type:complete
MTTTVVLPQPYLLFLGDETEPGYAKTAFGLRDWAPEKCIGEYVTSDDAVATGLPRISLAEATERGARSLVIGVANRGGLISAAWIPTLLEAITVGLDLVNGLHARLGDIPELVEAAARHGRRLIDIRTPPANIPVATGAKRTGKRLLTVGTDCHLGKKYTAMALTAAFVARGKNTDFRATGQTGIMIAGGGMPMDAVVSDFEAGAAEILSPAAAEDHWDVIEGQGSLFHPGYAPVSLGLLHGSQPDVLVVCHEPGRTRMLGTAGFPVATVEDALDLNLRHASLTNKAVRCAGVSFNTSRLSEEDAVALMERESARLGMPVADPMRGGGQFDRLVDACLA